MRPRGGVIPAVVFSAAMVALALSAHRPSLLASRAGGIVVAACALAFGLGRVRHPMDLLGLSHFSLLRLVYLPAVIGVGVALAVYHRWHVQGSAVPDHLTWFGVLIIGIGA